MHQFVLRFIATISGLFFSVLLCAANGAVEATLICSDVYLSKDVTSDGVVALNLPWKMKIRYAPMDCDELVLPVVIREDVLKLYRFPIIKVTSEDGHDIPVYISSSNPGTVSSLHLAPRASLLVGIIDETCAKITKAGNYTLTVELDLMSAGGKKIPVLMTRNFRAERRGLKTGD